jgi:hypothetical protein
MVEQSWETSPEVVMDNPLGGISRRWDKIKETHQRLFNGANRVEVEFWDYTIIGDEDFFVAIGRERGSLTNAGGTIELRIRTSRFWPLGIASRLR